MKKQQLSLALRPNRLSGLVGSKKIITVIRGHFKKRPPKAMMFIGETGAGKTTLARIISLSLQCRHQEKFGEPCDDCIKTRTKFDITEINCSDLTGIDELRRALEGAYYTPKPGSRNRAYILDEAQMLSKNSQNFLLKLFEDGGADTTKFFICTTDPQRIIRTLRSRCLTYTLPSLDLDDIKVLVEKALKYADSELPAAPLADALLEQTITSPRLVLMAVEKYLVGEDPETAARVEMATEFDTQAICSSMRRGDWDGVRTQLRNASSEDCRAIRASICGYLRVMLLESEEMDDRTKIVASAIEKMSMSVEDSILLSVVAAQLFSMTRLFSKYKH